MEETERKIMEKKCIYCQKVFISLSKKQLEYNYYAHVGACKSKRDRIKQTGGIK